MDDSNLIEKISCDACGSSDANAVYDDGHSQCFSCGEYKKLYASESSTQSTTRGKPMNLVHGEEITRTIRGITPNTFKFWKYQEGTMSGGDRVHIANHFKDGKKSGQKIRFQNKDFKVLGKMDSLYGRWLWNKGQGKKIVITEGELDALSLSQAQGNKWPVVSIPNGAQGSIKSIRDSIDYLESFEEVILMFDMDEPGQDAALKAAELFSPGKCKIAKLPSGYKDANEMLVAGKIQELTGAMWNAEPYRPDGIVTLDAVLEDVLKPIEMGIPWAWSTLTRLTYGRRVTENYYLGAGTGCGKTAIIAEQVHFDITELEVRCGCIYLEQSPHETFRRLAGLIGNRKFHKPMKEGKWKMEELEAAVAKIPSDKVFLYDSRGSTDWDILKERIRFMAVSQECKHIFIDNLTGITTEEGEREGLERVVQEINSLSLELNIIVHIVSHLATPEGKSHEEGGKVLPKHFRGSRVIMFYANYIIGFERNQLADDEEERNITTVRIGKDRNTGEATGQTFQLRYSHETGRITEFEGESEDPFDDSEDEF